MPQRAAAGSRLSWWPRRRPAIPSDLRGAQGVQLGGNNVQHNYFHGRFGPRTPLEEAAQELAEDVRAYWLAAAKARQITTPAPVRVRWGWGTADVAADRAEVGSAAATGVTPRALPDPDRDLVVLASGVVSRLHDEVYARLPHGRLVLLGAPGAGKTGAMILLLLDALRHRNAFPDARRMEVPVPVWLTLGGWNPATTPLAEWARSVIARDYPNLRPTFGRDLIAELLDGGHLALFLDGLDEMPPDLRAGALERLDREALDLRIVLTSRRDEYRLARADGALHNAAVIEVRPVRARDAAAYLLRDQLADQRPGWQAVGAHLQAHPDSVAATTLDNPLTLSLARSAYRQADPTGLINPGGFPTEVTLREHLLDRFLVVAYPDGRRRDQAVFWLSWIAHRMGTDRDLAWWQIPDWIPRWRRTLHIARAAILPLWSTILVSLIALLIFSSVGNTDLWTGRSEHGFLWRYWFQIGLAGGLVVWLGRRLVARQGGGRSVEPGRLRPRWPEPGEFIGLARVVGTAAVVIGLAVGLTTELGALLWTATDRAITDGLTAQILAGSNVDAAAGSVLAVGAGLGIPAGLVLGLHRLWSVPVRRVAAATPRAIYVDDRRSSRWMSLAAGLLVGLGVGLIMGNTFAPVIGVIYGMVLGIWIGLVGRHMFGVASTLAYTERYRGRTAGRPRPRFIPLLEEALEQQVLRQAGAVYQFRHAELQDHLARQYRSRYNVEPVAPVELCSPAVSLVPRSGRGRALAVGVVVALLATVAVVATPTVTAMIYPDHITLVGTEARASSNDLAFSPDGRLLAWPHRGPTTSWTTELWDLSEHRIVHTMDGFTFDGRSFIRNGRILTTQNGSTLQFWEVRTGRILATLSLGARDDPVGFSPDERYLVTANRDDPNDDTRLLWNLADGSSRTLPDAPIFSPDGTTMATGGKKGRATLSEVATGRTITTLTGEGSAVAFSPDGRLVATKGDGVVQLWDVGTGTSTATFPTQGSDVALSPDWRLLATDGDGTVQLWDVGTGMNTATLPARGSPRFSPDGRLLVTSDDGFWQIGSGNGQAGFHQVWDTTSGALITTLTFGDDRTWGPMFSGDGTLVTVWHRSDFRAPEPYRVRLWDVASGTRTLEGGDSQLLDLALSPDGKSLATGWSDGRVRIWGLAGNAPR